LKEKNQCSYVTILQKKNAFGIYQIDYALRGHLHIDAIHFRRLSPLYINYNDKINLLTFTTWRKQHYTTFTTWRKQHYTRITPVHHITIVPRINCNSKLGLLTVKMINTSHFKIRFNEIYIFNMYLSY